MAVLYSTLTDKGQVTIPSRLRRRLGLVPGLRLTLREVEGGVLVEMPPTMAAARQQAQKEMRQAKTWGPDVMVAGAWAHEAAKKMEPDRG